jgi:hypothetical protein
MGAALLRHLGYFRIAIILPESTANANGWLDHSVEAPLRGARRKQGSILLTHIDIE